MGYNYNMYIDELEKYCSSNSEMSHKVKELKKIISTMNDELKKLCIGFTSEDYTREEIKKMDENKIHKLFSSIIEDTKNIYFKYNDITSNIYISNFYFVGIEFYKDKVELVYERFGGDDEYIYIFLTEDEFFNEDAKSFLNRMKEEYNKEKIAKEKKKEYDKKKEIEYLKKRLKELTEENLSND